MTNSYGTASAKSQTTMLEGTLAQSDSILRHDPLEIAFRIGRRIARQRIQNGDEARWLVRTIGRPGASKHESIQATSGPGLYSGTAGIGLFLTELFAKTRDSLIADAALGAMASAMTHSSTGSLGLFGGDVGVALALCRAAKVFEREEIARHAASRVARLESLIKRDEALDVIGGVAGTAIGLWELKRSYSHCIPDCDGLLQMCGERILETAMFDPYGFSWRSLAARVRNLTGFAHGAAGIAAACIYCFSTTGDPRFLEASDLAFRYEDQFFAADVGNWLDLRHIEANDLAYALEPSKIREQLLSRGLEPYTPTCSTAWCHGSPGIGFSRLLAYAATGDKRYLEKVYRAVEGILASIHLARGWSQCHGIAGNSEFLLLAGKALGLPYIRPLISRIVDAGVELYELAEREWPSGVVDKKQDPSLMLGDAGIGLLYLRLGDPNLFSPLYPHPPPPREPPLAEDWSSSTVRYLSANVPHTYRLLARQGISPLNLLSRKLQAPTPSDVLRNALDAGASLGGTTRSALDEAISLDQQLLLLQSNGRDWIQPWFHSLEGEREVDQTTLLQVAPGVSVLATSHQWSNWLSDDNSPLVPPLGPEWLCIQTPFGSGTALIHLSRLEAAIVELLSSPMTLDLLVEGLLTRVNGRVDTNHLHRIVVTVLQGLQTDGIITSESMSTIAYEPFVTWAPTI